MKQNKGGCSEIFPLIIFRLIFLYIAFLVNIIGQYIVFGIILSIIAIIYLIKNKSDVVKSFLKVVLEIVGSIPIWQNDLEECRSKAKIDDFVEKIFSSFLEHNIKTNKSNSFGYNFDDKTKDIEQNYKYHNIDDILEDKNNTIDDDYTGNKYGTNSFGNNTKGKSIWDDYESVLDLMKKSRK